MANFLNPLNPSNFGMNVTGNFNNLSSAGTFRLPNSDLLNKINSKGGPSRDPIGTVQFSAGGGNFDSNPNIYIRDEELGEHGHALGEHDVEPGRRKLALSRTLPNGSAQRFAQNSSRTRRTWSSGSRAP